MTPHLLAEDPEEFEYDDDGNLTKDGRWLYTWDADEARQRGDGAPEACPEGGKNRVPHGRDIPQSRLISMEARADLKSGLPRWKYQFTYDYMGRRVQKTSHSWDDAQVWNNDADERFVYDGWNLFRASGEAAHVNPFRFSTKYHDTETGMYYYGYRYYSLGIGTVFESGSFGRRGWDRPLCICSERSGE